MIYESVEPMHGGEETLSWVLDQSALPARAYRSAQAASLREVSWRGSLGRLTPILWLGLLLTYGAWPVEKAET